MMRAAATQLLEKCFQLLDLAIALWHDPPQHKILDSRKTLRR